MKDKGKNIGENNLGASTSGSESDRLGLPTAPDRRRFSRVALGGGVVLASLGNRNAWGQTGVGCMSVMTLASFNPGTGMFVSAPGGRPGHNEELAAEIHYVSDGNRRYLGTGVGTDGTTVYTACRSRTNRDSVCLIEGRRPRGRCPRNG